MKAIIEINMDNNCFMDGSDELGRIFTQLASNHTARYLREDEDKNCSVWGLPILDINGNKVGELRVQAR
jgi:hypothetical protein